MSPYETHMAEDINATSILEDMAMLESIGNAHPASRSAGSQGANESADWILSRFESMGLAAEKESLDFRTWDLRSSPSLMLDEDGNASTTGDHTDLASFDCEQWSSATPAEGVIGTVQVLSLPSAASYDELGANPIDTMAWSEINISNKVLVIGKEVRWVPAWQTAFISKLSEERPMAVVFIWWYDWMAPLDAMVHGSVGGGPMGVSGTFFWDLQMPVGGVNFSEGRTLIAADNSSTATVRIESMVSEGQLYNVVASLPGEAEPSKRILVTGHYDSILTNGFCDNAGGVAAVLAIAGTLAQGASSGSFHPRYTLTFVAFTGEELGCVGSLNYIHMHSDQMSSIVAVLNFDCIGAERMVVTRTQPFGGLDLDEVLWTAASDLSVPVLMEDPGGSDQDSFLNPTSTSWVYVHNWDLDIELPSESVMESCGLASEPILYTSIFSGNDFGWIHTAKDSGDFALGSGWLSGARLADQTRVGLLAVLRIGSAEVEDAVPSTPGALTATAGNSFVDLNWTAPAFNGGSPITNYNVYISTTETGTYSLIASPSGLTYTDTGLTNGQTYWYKVSAINAIGEGANCSAVSATPYTVPNAPTGLTAAPGNAQVTLAWIAPTFNGGRTIDYYIAYRNGTDVAHPTIMTATITGLTNGQAYSFTIAAHNLAGIGAQSIAISSTPFTVPNAPTGLTATPSNAQATLTWTDPASDGGAPITSYKLYRSTASDGTYTLVTSPTAPTYADIGLINGQTYWYKVSAVNAVGEGAQSPAVSALVPQPVSSGIDSMMLILMAAVAIGLVLVAVSFVLRKRKSKK